MAYLRGYDHDVFVSYSLKNNLLTLDAQPWVTRLVELLKNQMLNRLEGNADELKFYFAQGGSIGPGQQLANCRDDAKRSAMFLLIGSPRSGDGWPTSELRAFREAPGSLERIFVAELLPPGGGGYPSEIENPFRSQFWRLMGKTENTYSTSTGPCEELLVELAAAIAEKLDAIYEREKLPTAERPPDPNLRKVLIARSALTKKSQEVRDFLKPYGIEVIFAADLKEAGQAFRDKFGQMLAEKPIVVQLLGPYPAPSDDQIEEGYDAFQSEAAKSCADVELFQWRDPRLPIVVEDEEHRNLLENCEYAMDNFQEFMSLIEKATKIVAQPVKKQSFWFIDADRSDEEMLQKVQAYCDSKKIKAMRPRYGVDEEEDWFRNYTDAHGIAVIHSRSGTKWADSKQRLFMNTSSNSEAAQRMLLYLAPAPPKTKNDCVIITHPGLEVIEAADETLDPLFKVLGR